MTLKKRAMMKKKKVMMRKTRKMKKKMTKMTKKKSLKIHWTECVQNVLRSLLVNHSVIITKSALRELPKNNKKRVMNIKLTKKIVWRSFSIYNTASMTVLLLSFSTN